MNIPTSFLCGDIIIYKQHTLKDEDVEALKEARANFIEYLINNVPEGGYPIEARLVIYNIYVNVLGGHPKDICYYIEPLSSDDEGRGIAPIGAIIGAVTTAGKVAYEQIKKKKEEKKRKREEEERRKREEQQKREEEERRRREKEEQERRYKQLLEEQKKQQEQLLKEIKQQQQQWQQQWQQLLISATKTPKVETEKKDTETTKKTLRTGLTIEEDTKEEKEKTPEKKTSKTTLFIVIGIVVIGIIIGIYFIRKRS